MGPEPAALADPFSAAGPHPPEPGRPNPHQAAFLGSCRGYCFAAANASRIGRRTVHCSIQGSQPGESALHPSDVAGLAGYPQLSIELDAVDDTIGRAHLQVLPSNRDPSLDPNSNRTEIYGKELPGLRGWNFNRNIYTIARPTTRSQRPARDSICPVLCQKIFRFAVPPNQFLNFRV
jgi:hypothetical protein